MNRDEPWDAYDTYQCICLSVAVGLLVFWWFFGGDPNQYICLRKDEVIDLSQVKK